MDWQRRFLSYLSLDNERYQEIADHYLRYADRPHTDDEMNRIYDAPEEQRRGREFDRQDKVKHLQTKLYHLLMQMLKAQAYVLVRTSNETNGFECLRLLRVQFGRTRRQRLLALVDRIVNLRLDGPNLSEKLVRWEHEVADFELANEAPLGDLLKMTLLIRGTSGALNQHLRLTIDEQADYAAVRTVVVNYLNTVGLKAGRDPGGPGPGFGVTAQPMEVDAYRKGKGKRRTSGLPYFRRPGGKGGKADFHSKGIADFRPKGYGKKAKEEKAKGKEKEQEEGRGQLVTIADAPVTSQKSALGRHIEFITSERRRMTTTSSFMMRSTTSTTTSTATSSRLSRITGTSRTTRRRTSATTFVRIPAIICRRRRTLSQHFRHAFCVIRKQALRREPMRLCLCIPPR